MREVKVKVKVKVKAKAKARARGKDYGILFIVCLIFVLVQGLLFKTLQFSSAEDFGFLLGSALAPFIVSALFMKFKSIRAAYIALLVLMFLSSLGKYKNQEQNINAIVQNQQVEATFKASYMKGCLRSEESSRSQCEYVYDRLLEQYTPKEIMDAFEAKGDSPKRKEIEQFLSWTGFISSCMRNGGSRSECECAFNKLLERYTMREVIDAFTEESMSPQREQIEQFISEFIPDCIKK